MKHYESPEIVLNEMPAVDILQSSDTEINPFSTSTNDF